MRPSIPLIVLFLASMLFACGDTGSSAGTGTPPGEPDVTSPAEDATSTGDTLAGPDTTPGDPDTTPTDPDTTPSGVCDGAEDGTPCDDDNACTEGDTCTAGLCTGGTNTVCDSTDPCRSSGCDPDIGCYSTDEPDGTTCQIGCFDTATCQSGSCEVDPDSAVVCPEPEDPCVDQLQCDADSGACTISIFKAVGSACDADENICTEDLCTDTGACEPTGVTNTCEAQNADNPCWTWSCAAKTGCYQTAFVEGVSCDDNSPCTYSDICTVNEFDQELCVGEPLPIDDENICTDDACDGGTITHTPIDGISCEVEGCESPGLCSAGQCEAPEECSCTPVDGGWSDWTLGDCQTECDMGELLATRTCTNPVPSCGGADCVGDASETQSCAGGDCADGYWCDAGSCIEQCESIPGGWSDWTWGPCSVECGGGVQIGTRTCTNPAPVCNGAMCLGDNETEAPCNTDPCPDGTLPLGTTVYDHAEEVVTGTVPDGVTSITVSLWGGGGAGGLPGIGGAGAWVHGTLPVTPGDSVELRVAGGGTDAGRGGGASYAFVNGEVMLVAAGGGGAGSDGNSGKSADAGSGSGGGGGALGDTGQAGTLNDVYSCGSAGGQGGQQAAGGAGGTSDNQSIYTSDCISPGQAGTMHQGGGTHKGGSCSVSQSGGSWHLGGTTSATNGEGGGGGGGYYGGGSGATFYTYAGGGGGGGASWAHASVTATQSEAGNGPSSGGQGAANYNGTAGKGGQAGDHSDWPTNTIDPEPGATGLVVLSL